jgi:hypothetical protein
MYAKILEQIQGMHEGEKDLAMAVLLWVAFALWPLSVTEI